MTKDRSKRANFVRKLMDTRKDMGDKAIEHIHEVRIVHIEDFNSLLLLSYFLSSGALESWP